MRPTTYRCAEIVPRLPPGEGRGEGRRTGRPRRWQTVLVRAFSCAGPHPTLSRRERGLGAGALALVMLFVSVSFSQTTKPTEALPTTSCVTSTCHADVKNFKVLHGPV